MNFSHLSDEALIIQHRQSGYDYNDPKLLEEMVCRHQNFVIQRCAYLVKDPETARDVAQEVWIRVLTKLDQFRPERAKFTAWLFIIVRNRCHDHLRKDKTAPNEEISQKVVNTLEDELDTDELTRPTIEILEELMEQINGEEKHLLMLKYYHGYSLGDIQQSLGLTKSCVKTRLARVRHKLQKLLDKYQERHAV